MAWMNSATPNLAWHCSPTPFTLKWRSIFDVGWSIWFTAKWCSTAMAYIAWVGVGLRGIF